MPLVVFRNGAVWTGREDISALAIHDGRIVALGGEALALSRDADQVIDLAGGFLMPAFGDGHCHPDQAGFEALGPQIRPCRSVAAIVAEVARFAAEHPEQEWIRGGSYDSTLAPDGLFDAHWLDAVVPDRPVALRAWDYHTLWCNTEAMRRAGLDTGGRDTARGRFVRRADGSLLGTMQEWDAVDAVLDAFPPRPKQARVEALRIATTEYARCGVTWIQDAWVEHDMVEAYVAAADQGLLATRVNLAFRADPARWREQLAEFAHDRRRVAGHARLAARTVKFFLDGIIENRTAAMLAPYADDPCTRGMPNWDPTALRAALVEVDRMNLQAHLHVIGDAAVRSALDAIEFVRQRNGIRDRRPILAHSHVVDPADIPRFAQLGVVANFQPLWAQTDAAMELLTVPRLGAPRSAHQYPIGSLLRSGARIGFGSDWPVTDHRPLAGLAVAVTRQTPDRLPAAGWLPEERIDVDSALRAYTAGVAYQAYAERQRGLLAPGLTADLAWLARDPRRGDPHEIPRIAVLGTWLAGDATFRATHDETPAGHRPSR